MEVNLLQNAYEKAVLLGDRILDGDPCSLTMGDLFSTLRKLGYSWNGREWEYTGDAYVVIKREWK